MGLIVLLLIAVVVILFTIFSAQEIQQGEAVQIISGFIEVLIINFVLNIASISLLSLVASKLPSIPGFASISIYGLAGLGVLQLLYVVPRSLYLKRHQRWAKLKAVIAASVIMALLNGGCWVFLGTGLGSG